MEAVRVERVKAHSVKLHTRRYAYSDYAAWGTDDRYELLDGVPYMMAAPNVWHQKIAGKIYQQLENFLEGKRCVPYIAAVDVCLSGKGEDDINVVQPDVFVVCERSKITKKYINGAPDFIVEVLSPSTAKNDLTLKFTKYLEAGVRELWVVDPEARTLSSFVLNGGVYEKKHYEKPSVIPINVLSGCEIDMAAVFSAVVGE